MMTTSPRVKVTPIQPEDPLEASRDALVAATLEAHKEWKHDKDCPYSLKGWPTICTCMVETRYNRAYNVFHATLRAYLDIRKKTK